jgi:hypothetical protein
MGPNKRRRLFGVPLPDRYSNTNNNARHVGNEEEQRLLSIRKGVRCPEGVGRHYL